MAARSARGDCAISRGHRIFHVVSDGSPTGFGIAELRAERARWEVAWRAIRQLGAATFAGLFTAATVLNPAGPRPGSAGRGLLVSALLAAVLAAFAAVHVTMRRPGGPSLAAIGMLIASSATLVWVQPNGPGIVGVFTGVLLSALRMPWRWAASWSAVSFAALVTLAAVRQTSPVASVAVLTFIGGFFVVAYLARQLGEAAGLAEQLFAELERHREAQARAAGLAERQRLAREIHDVLGHMLSGLMLQLEGARMLAARDPASDPRLGEAIDQAQHLGKAGLEETRKAIGMLRGDDLPSMEHLSELAALFSANRGIPCRLTVSGPERRLGADACLAVYRVAQEAMTNITKHARPDCVEMHLAYLPDTVCLTVEDFGAPGAAAAPGQADGGRRPASVRDSGYGLTGMRERAELLGGALRAGPTRTGFRVELEVPECPPADLMPAGRQGH
jgi:signal transduction histidine kinase